MNVKKIAVIVTIILLLAFIVIFYLFHSVSASKLDPVAVNDIVQSVSEQWGGLDPSELPCMQNKLDYVVINENGTVIAATRRGLDESMSSAIANRDTVVDIRSGEAQVGKVIIYNDAGERWQTYRNDLCVLASAVLIFIILFIWVYAFYTDRMIFRPFRRLRAFAKNVASGNLDIPLAMDRDNMFGAFTESFDLLRDELARHERRKKKRRKANGNWWLLSAMILRRRCHPSRPFRN